MTAEIICVGNELLYGDTLNTNTQYLSQQMSMIGIEVKYQLVVGDHEEDLLSAVSTASERADIILFSGGLGPTYDDMTKETVAKALEQTLILDEDALADIRGYFDRAGRRMSESNIKQAYRPVGGVCLPNRNGTAPGIYVEKNNTHYFLLPGPPIELKPMYQEEVKPLLLDMTSHVIASRIYGLAGIGESDLADEIGAIMDHSENPRIAPYAKTGTVNIRITAKGSTEEESNDLLNKAANKLMPFINPYIYTENGEEIETVIVQMLTEKNITLSAAESCTGGMLSSRIVNVPGASEVYMNSFVTYSNEAKMQWLEVNESILETCGAVSEEVARAMAEGVRKVSGTDLGVGITGIAGPGGGTEEKPVGTVCIAVAGDGDTRVKTYRFSGNRQKIRELSAQFALVQIFRYLNLNDQGK